MGTMFLSLFLQGKGKDTNRYIHAILLPEADASAWIQLLRGLDKVWGHTRSHEKSTAGCLAKARAAAAPGWKLVGEGSDRQSRF